MDYKVSEIKLSPEIAGQKIRNWCAYQERSQFDVRKKLSSLGVDEDNREAIIAQLIAENYINEQRFADAFAGGKTRMKGWGRQKIKRELLQHKVPDTIIRETLSELNEAEYYERMQKLIEKKLQGQEKTDRRKVFASVYRFMLNKGYESELVIKELNSQLGDIENES